MKNNRGFIRLLCCTVVLCVTSGVASARALPESLKDTFDTMIRAELEAGAFPGASFWVGDREGLFFAKTYGWHDYSKRLPVRSDDLFDVASCTKVLATTFAVMRLYDAGRIDLRAPMVNYMPEWAATPFATVRIEELLTHTSGLPPQVLFHPLLCNAEGGALFSGTRSERYPYEVGRNYYVARSVGYDTRLLDRTPHEGWRRVSDSLYANPAADTLFLRQICDGYRPDLRGKYAYSCSNMWLLKQIVERIAGRSLGDITRSLYAEMGCKHSVFNPLRHFSKKHCMPTEVDHVLARDTVCGYVHDELAALVGGEGGNAGLFTTAHDMACFCEMILSGGTFHGRRILSQKTVELFTSSPMSASGVWRGYGFDKRNPANGALGGEATFGHTGFTGTMFWMDARKGVYMIFLSNAVHPTRLNDRLNDSMLRTNLWIKIDR